MHKIIYFNNTKEPKLNTVSLHLHSDTALSQTVVGFITSGVVSLPSFR